MKKAMLIHNPHCSKSRSAKDILTDRGIEFDTIDYLKDGLKEKLLKKLPLFLGVSYIEMIRMNESVYKELNLADKSMSDEEWVEMLMKNPILLERPIFIYGEKAVIARPPELVLELL